MFARSVHDGWDAWGNTDVLASYQSKDESGGINNGFYIQHKESLF